MRRKISLYIDGRLVDLDEESFILMNYTQEDTTDPAIVKNSFSQSIKLKGTPANNAIFGGLWRLDRRTQNGGGHSGVDFSAAAKAPFSLYNELGEILESGYCKVDSVSRKGGQIEYKVTLFGGLGSFFQNLSFRPDGEKMTLADLDFLGTPSPENEFDFIIDRYAVLAAWGELRGQAPSYPVTPTQTQSGKVIKTNGILGNTSVAGSYVSTYNVVGLSKILFSGTKPSGTGYCLAAVYNNNGIVLDTLEVGAGTVTSIVDEAYTLPVGAVSMNIYGRSTYHREGLKWVDVNPLWQTLNFAPCYNGIPQGTFDADKAIVQAATAGLKTYEEGAVARKGLVLVTLGKEQTEWFTKDLRSYLQKPVIKWSAIIDAICDPDNNGGYDVDLDPEFFTASNPYYNDTWLTLPLLNTLNVDIRHVTHELILQEDTSIVIPEGDDTSINYVVRLIFKPKIKLDGISSVAVAMDVTDGDENYMNYLEYTASAYDSGNNLISQTIVRVSTRQNEEDQTPQMDIIGEFDNQGNWQNDDLFLVVEGMGIHHVVFHKEVKGLKWGPTTYPVDTDIVWEKDAHLYTRNHGVDEYLQLAGDEDSSVQFDAGGTARSGATITKKMLLSSSNTPADYLISYCKMFGLQFVTDKIGKKVSILLRKNFFDGTTIDMTERVDLKEGLDQTPLVFDKKWYEFSTKNDKGEFIDYYRNIYAKNYGVQRVNTGYEFNADTKQVMDSIVFNGCAEVLENAKYFMDITQGALYLPSVFLDAGSTYSLYKGDGENLELDLPIPSGMATAEWLNAANPTYDLFSKPQFHEKDNKGMDERDTLLFFRGMQELTSTRYAVTDDNTDMMIMNDNTPCWWLDYQLIDPTAQVEALPMFGRYLMTGSQVVKSLDYGTPSEVQLPSVSFDPDSSIYAQYWEDYIHDRYDDDTCLLKCKVDLSGMQVNEELLRKFWFYQGCYWVLNRIINHSVTTYDLTECEFIKVQDMNNYTM